jgi:hypothetical protein
MQAAGCPSPGKKMWEAAGRHRRELVLQKEGTAKAFSTLYPQPFEGQTERPGGWIRVRKGRQGQIHPRGSKPGHSAGCRTGGGNGLVGIGRLKTQPGCCEL